eukprot:1708094-Prymnesium_polylepis.1
MDAQPRYTPPEDLGYSLCDRAEELGRAGVAKGQACVSEEAPSGGMGNHEVVATFRADGGTPKSIPKVTTSKMGARALHPLSARFTRVWSG